MRVSFDIDDLLVCRPHVPVEDSPFPRLWWSRGEPLRRGTAELMKALRSRGCEIWIYTTSDRSPAYISGWMRRYGICVDGVIHHGVHQEVVGAEGPSKYPPAFGIDLHIDDSEGVAREGRLHGFPVIVIRPDDRGWVAGVIAAVDAHIAANDCRAL